MSVFLSTTWDLQNEKYPHKILALQVSHARRKYRPKRWKQAELSRATLEISSEFSSYFPLRAFIVYALWSPQSDKVVAEMSRFNILSLFSNVGCLHFKQCKFQIWGRSDQRLLRYSTFNILWSSSIRDYLYFKQFLTLVWSQSESLKF